MTKLLNLFLLLNIISFNSYANLITGEYLANNSESLNQIELFNLVEENAKQKCNGEVELLDGHRQTNLNQQTLVSAHFNCISFLTKAALPPEYREQNRQHRGGTCTTTTTCTHPRQGRGRGCSDPRFCD